MFHWSKKKRGWWFWAVGAAVLLVGTVGYLNAGRDEGQKLISSFSGAEGSTVSETQFSADPFFTMTMPYLRGRSYESELGELEKLNEGATYTSYLTSFESDGLRVNGLLTIPKGEEPSGGWPAVVFVHGYIPPTVYRTQVNYVSYVDFLAERGLVVFKIDLRGHDQSQGEPGGSYYSGDYIIDTLNARAALAATDFVNPNKVGLWGHSMAGNVVFRALAADPTIQRVVIWAGAVYTYEDMRELGINDNDYAPPKAEPSLHVLRTYNSYRPPGADTERQRKRAQLREAHGEFDPNDPFWQQVPGTNYLNDMTGAVQIHHAVDDSVVTIDYSRNLIGLLKEVGVRGELFEYSSGGHNLTGGTFTRAMQRSSEFLKNY